jgi:hypothetical protein
VPKTAHLRGHTAARLATPPLRDLTPETSYGFAVVVFARDVLGEPLDPWQEWLVIRAGELLSDGRPRFRHVLVLVARQNGKTHLLKVLALYWMFVEAWALVVGTSTNLDYARESWESAVAMAEGSEVLALSIPRNGVRRANGEQCLTTVDKCRYKIAASNRKGGRSLSIDRLIMDELREHRDWSAWDAAVPAMNARPAAQAWAITNQGDDSSVVLNAQRDSAIEYLTSGAGDPRLGLFEWSADDEMPVDDPEAWVMANPNLGHRIDVDTIAGPAARARIAGGEQEAGFRTEVLCQRVRALAGAVDPVKWRESMAPGDLADLRGRVALCLDVSPDQMHATLAAAGVYPDDRSRVAIAGAWSGPNATRDMRRALPSLVATIKPRVIGWFPAGPGAALAAGMSDRRVRGVAWPPAGTVVEEIRAEVSAVCMGFAEQVRTVQVLHAPDALADAHVTGAEKLRSKNGDTWRFSRRGEGHCDAAYALAGALHLARTLPAPVGKPRIVIAV